MVKFAITFRQPQNVAVFENAYNDLLALIEQMPGIRRRQVVNVLGSPMGDAPYYRVLEVYFDDMERLRASLRSEAGQAAGSELGRRFEGGTYQAWFAEVYEEDGGQTADAGTGKD
jgi:uncharacterized protein (TIGR02118 family)